MVRASCRSLIPNPVKRMTAASCVYFTGSSVGTMCPISADRMVISASAPMAPENTTMRSFRMAMRHAMKKVLSPISLARMANHDFTKPSTRSPEGSGVACCFSWWCSTTCCALSSCDASAAHAAQPTKASRHSACTTFTLIIAAVCFAGGKIKGGWKIKSQKGGRGVGNENNGKDRGKLKGRRGG